MESDGLAGSIIILALILLKAFLAVCENAVAEIGDSKLKTFENGNAAEKRLYSMHSFLRCRFHKMFSRS